MLEIISLIEDYSSNPVLSSEIGLSLYVVQNNKKYLVDTGATDSFIQNAHNLGVDLKNLDGIIITHNHYDHVGGLPALLKYNQNVKVYINSAAKSDYFYGDRYIGEEQSLFLDYYDRFIFLDEDYAISDSITLLSNSKNNKYYGNQDLQFYEKIKGKLTPDEFRHELFVAIREKGNLVLISSCSHNGIVNIIKTLEEKIKNIKLSHIIGGFHMAGKGNELLNCTEEYVKEVAQILDQSCDRVIYTCHCTGRNAYEIMSNMIGNKIVYFSTGEKIVI